MNDITVVLTGTDGVPGGIAALNLNILLAVQEHVQDRGGAVTVLSYLDKQTDRPECLEEKVEFRGYNGQKAQFVAALLREAARGVNFFFDHVTLVPPILPFQIFGHVNTVVFAHGSEAWRKVRRSSQWALQAADLCLTNSAFTLSKMQSRLPPFTGDTCPLGLSPRFELNENVPEDCDEMVRLRAVDGRKRGLGDRVLLLVGRMERGEPGKGRRPLIRILPDLHTHHPDAQLVFPGAGNEVEDLRAFAREHEVTSSVFLPGYVSTKALERLYKSCYAYVMPSRQEGFGLAYLEAMNYGAPCIGCWDDGAEDVITHGETGYLVEGGNDEALRDAIVRLLNDPQRAEEMGTKGFEKLHRTFTSRHFRDRFRNKIRGVFQ